MNNNLFSLIAEGNILAENTLYIEFFEINRNYILNNSGGAEDVEDNYHEALIIFIEKLRNGTLNPNDAGPQYFFGICRNLWLKELKKRNRHENTVTNLEFEEYIDDEVDIRFGKYYSRFMYRALKVMEDSRKKNIRQCSELLPLRYLELVSYEKLAIKFKISLEAIKKRVSRCKNKLSELSHQLEREFYD